MQPTQRPWIIGNATEIHAGDGTRIVMCCQTDDDAEQCRAEANARLIAAAPDLLEALERLSFAAMCRDNTVGDPCRLIAVKAELAAAVAQARAVIASAKGGAA